MPKAFNNCVKNGGKVRTKNLKNNRYIRICYDKQGKAHSGKVMTRQKKSNEEKIKTNVKHKRISESKKLAKSLLELKKHFDSNHHQD